LKEKEIFEIDGFSKETVFNFWGFKLENLIRAKHPEVLNCDEGGGPHELDRN